MKRFIFNVTMILFLMSAFSADASISIIVNKNNLNEVSSARIKQLFTLRKSEFKDGQQAVLYLPEEGATRETFLNSVLFYSESRLRKRYVKMERSGKGTAPNEVNDEEILKAVSSHPNAIGVVPSDLVNEQVKVIATVE